VKFQIQPDRLVILGGAAPGSSTGITPVISS
jgi:hypothetical protein